MTDSDHSKRHEAIAQGLAELAAASATLAQDADQPLPANVDLADDAEIAHVQEQLRALIAKADAMDAEATRLAQESSGSASTEAEQARNQADAMRGAATKAQNAIASAPTDAKTGKKRISSAKLDGIASIIAHVTAGAEEETHALSAAITEVRSHNAKHTSTKAAPASKPTIAARVSGAIFGHHAGSSHAGKGHGRDNDEDEDEEFHPLMNRRERRNHDGIVSGREAAVGAVGLVRALGSKKKRATYVRLIGEMQDAVGAHDERAMRDVAHDVGLGVKNTTGSDDLGYLANTAVGTGITKGHTGFGLLYNLDVMGVAGAAGRLLNTWGGIASDAVGRNTLANNIRPLLGQLMHDKNVDWENLVDDKRVKQFDTDNNGVIDAPDIIKVLRNNGMASMNAVDKNKDGTITYGELSGVLYQIAKKNHAHVEGRAPAADKPHTKAPTTPKGAMVILDGYGRMTIEAARDMLLNKHVKIDKNGDGITYGEARAAVAQWNATHAANGEALAPSASPAHTKSHGPAQRPNK